MPSGQFHLESSADGARGTLERVQLDLVVGRIEQPLHLRAARMHSLRHLDLPDPALLHGFGDLPREHPLLRKIEDLIPSPALFQEALE
jgi:hypothetical protein